jgi:hypothetical protein
VRAFDSDTLLKLFPKERVFFPRPPFAASGNSNAQAMAFWPAVILRRSLRSATPNPKARGWMFLFYPALSTEQRRKNPKRPPPSFSS